jgi:hypothetical protein
MTLERHWLDFKVRSFLHPVLLREICDYSICAIDDMVMITLDPGAPWLWTWRQCVSVFRNDLALMVLRLCVYIAWNPLDIDELIAAVQTGIELLTSTVGLLGGDLKGVLYVATVFHLVSHVRPDMNRLREEFSTIILAAQTTLDEYEELHPTSAEEPEQELRNWTAEDESTTDLFGNVFEDVSSTSFLWI